MAIVVKTNWKAQDTVSPAHFNRVEGNIGELETLIIGLTNNKVDKVSGKGLSTNDFSNTYVTKISTLESDVGTLTSNKLNASEFTAEKIGLLFAGNNKELNATKLNNQSGSYYAAASTLTSHTGNKSNPHGVTKAQVGLGNVNNYSDATSENIVDGTANRYVTASAMKTAIGSMKAGDSAKLNNQSASYYAKASDVTAHTNNKSNPHSVTKLQVGLGNVNNYSDATSAQIVSGTANKYVTASAMASAIGSMKSGDSARLNGQSASYYARQILRGTGAPPSTLATNVLYVQY